LIFLPALLSAAGFSAGSRPVIKVSIDNSPRFLVKNFLIYDGGLYLAAGEVFKGLGLKPSFSPDLNTFYLNLPGGKLEAELKSGRALLSSREMKFRGGFWKESELFLAEDFLTEVYARAKGCAVAIEKPGSIKNYQSALRLPEKFKKDPVRVIVLDPGHGGQSLGANTPGGWREKDLTLRLALKLKTRLDAVPGIKVQLTRDEDVEIGLDQRAEFANRQNADLFLSIHTNACGRKSASGFETYFLSLNATDEESRRLAIWENLELSGDRQDHSRELDKKNLSELDLILGDMAQSEHLAESEVFAKIIQNNLAQIMKNPNRGVKQAPFKVLMAANMPAALVELGFLTNARDQRNITSEEHQDRIVLILAQSILEFRELKAKKLGMAVKK